MKTLLVCFSLLFSLATQAKVVGRVLEVQGNAFSFAGKDATSLKYGSKIYDLMEVMVEDDSTVSIVNPQGHIFHVNGGSLVKFYNGVLELKNGYVWVKSNESTKGLFNTSNSIGQYGEGEFILSTDNITGKTQLLVLTGDVKFSNALEPTLSTKVSSGFFSLVDPKYENGLPRTPTKVGLKSYKQMKMVFSNFKDIQKSNYEETMWGEKKTTAKRSIASVTPVPAKTASKRRGRLITITTYSASRTPASTGGAMDYYMDMKKRNAWKYRPFQTNQEAPVRYFGVKPVKTTKTMKAKPATVKRAIASKPEVKVKRTVNRVPASVQKTQLIHDLKKSGFEKSLDMESKKIRRNSNEVNNLIDELQTYKQDYKKNY